MFLTVTVFWNNWVFNEGNITSTLYQTSATMSHKWFYTKWIVFELDLKTLAWSKKSQRHTKLYRITAESLVPESSSIAVVLLFSTGFALGFISHSFAAAFTLTAEWRVGFGSGGTTAGEEISCGESEDHTSIGLKTSFSTRILIKSTKNPSTEFSFY